MEERPALSIVIPAYNGAEDLDRCLKALFRADLSDIEIIVVNDGSDDPMVDRVIAAHNVISIRCETNLGRGPARNVGVCQASGNFVLFLDADVEVPARAIEDVLVIIRNNPDIGAFFGSYDDAPACPRSASQYRNLLHHYTHQTAPCTAPHFWTGFGVVRTELFHEIGGFDSGQWARNMEEVEFGHRLTTVAGQKIRLFKGLQVKHLKSYSLAKMIKSDLLDRAIPWTLFIHEHKTASNQFVTSGRQKSSALAILLTLFAAMIPFWGVQALLISILGATWFVSLNLPFFDFCRRKKGTAFAVKAVWLHMIHIFCAGLGYGLGTLLYGVRQIGQTLKVRRTKAPVPLKLNKFSKKESDREHFRT